MRLMPSRALSHLRSTALATAAVLALVSCSGGGADGGGGQQDGGGSDSQAAPQVAAAQLEAGPLLVSGQTSTELGASTARELFDEARTVVLAAEGQEVRAGSAAASLGVPAIIDGPDTAAVLEELGAETALVIGDVKDPGIDVVVPTSDEELAQLIGGEVKQAGDNPLGALQGISPESPALLVPGDALAAPSFDADRDDLPEITAPEPITEMVALATADTPSLVAGGSAIAAGADLLVTPEGDPRSSGEAVQTLGEAGDDVAIIGLGDAFGDEETFTWQAETAATGVELPGGGQLVFNNKTYVALYGTPGVPVLGVLGEQDIDATITRAEEHAAMYEGLTSNTVVPTMEIIATVASAFPEEGNTYSNELPIEDLKPLIDAAGEAGHYVIIDLQPGRLDFLTQAKKYEELLRLPHVGLALDPEWRLGPNQKHLTQIGTVEISEVNQVVTWLADLTRENNLPQKVLVLHQFQTRMIPEADKVDQSRSEVAVLIHADGQGGQGAKQDTWQALHDNAPSVEHWGWKNFYDEDLPMLDPEDTMTTVDPVPDFISYQ